MALPLPTPADPDRAAPVVVMRTADLAGWARAARQQSRSTRAQASALRERVAARPARADVTELRTVQERAANLERALESNRRIGMAVGILMERHRVAEDAAFALLRAASNRTNTKLRDVAERVVYTGSLPR